MIESNLLQVLLAGILSALIGFVWYHPRAFGTLWMRLSGLTPDAVEKGKRRMHVDATLALVAGFFVAFALRYLEVTMGINDVVSAAKLGFLLWVGLVVPPLAGTVLWEQRPVTLFAINSAYWLVSFIAMSVILIF